LREAKGDSRLFRRVATRCAVLLAGGVAAIVLAGGCKTPAYLWADTDRTVAGFSDRRHQWAYDGEPVTFELRIDGATDYIVFGVAGEETVVETINRTGRFRWTRAFHAGPEPRQYEVFAAPFLIRRQPDWFYNKSEDAWELLRRRDDRPDIMVADEQVIWITCYRREIGMRFRVRGGPPRRVTLSVVKGTGERTAIPPKAGADEDTRGFVMLGPDEGGFCEVSYTPVHSEVSRGGATHVELLVEHADGSLERLRDEIDTP
jgi:hypothetical protein